MAATPLLQAALGSRRAVALLGGLAALGYGLTYLVHDAPLPTTPPLSSSSSPSSASMLRAGHVFLLLLGTTAGGALELLLQALCSTLVPPRAQGRLFALLSIVRLAGTITGSLYLAQLFQTSLDARGGGPSVLRGGALPLVALSLPAALNVAALSCALPTHVEERGVGLLAGGAGGRTSERGRPPRGSKDSNDTETTIRCDVTTRVSCPHGKPVLLHVE